mgnify:FL=1
MKEVIQKFRRSFGWQKKFVPPYPEYIKVFSHPRSGTHFLESFVGENFYSGIDLSRKNVEWGHWKNRQIDKEGFKYGKLFGSHLPPYPSLKKIDYPVLYIYRDGRAVAHSLYNYEQFIVPGKEQITFRLFLRN